MTWKVVESEGSLGWGVRQNWSFPSVCGTQS